MIWVFVKKYGERQGVGHDGDGCGWIRFQLKLVVYILSPRK
jgi:hypothetical protein